jgi:hypothetical protein
MNSKLPLCLALVLSGGLSGCSNNRHYVVMGDSYHNLVGQSVTFNGIAGSDARGAALYFPTNPPVEIEGLRRWSANYNKQRLQVTGVLVENYIVEPVDMEPVMAIPNAPHTPEEWWAKTPVYIVRHAKWTLLPDNNQP